MASQAAADETESQLDGLRTELEATSRRATLAEIRAEEAETRAWQAEERLAEKPHLSHRENEASRELVEATTAERD
jgi:hypothetical protein